MKYFEYSEPYYALIKASTAEQANGIYVDTVADNPTSPVEVKERDALLRDIHGNGGYPLKDGVAEFFNDEPMLLLVDGALT